MINSNENPILRGRIFKYPVPRVKRRGVEQTPRRTQFVEIQSNLTFVDYIIVRSKVTEIKRNRELHYVPAVNTENITVKFKVNMMLLH